jgi:hypothetical protein
MLVLALCLLEVCSRNAARLLCEALGSSLLLLHSLSSRRMHVCTSTPSLFRTFHRCCLMITILSALS